MTKEQFERQLNTCKNLREIFETCNTWYEIENCKLGIVSKPLIVKGIISALTILNPKERK
jgi:hypothetical protein